ncbi:MAG: 16S rRNA (uracil(1498)-N(3))-methyltransferase [Geobacteraceae bacterium]
MRRFFISPSSITNGAIIVTGALFRHIATVLRLKAGARLLLADGTGREFVGHISELGFDRLLFSVEDERLTPTPAAVPRITLYQGLPKVDKMELILQKATELGVDEIVPFVAARSIPRIRDEREGKRLARWQRITEEAARQSCRSSIPRIALADSLEEVLQSSQHSVKLFLWEKEQTNRLRQTLAGFTAPESVAVLVGPEGGLSTNEAASAISGGFTPVSLGARIVRTETAGFVMLAILQFLWGDIG